MTATPRHRHMKTTQPLALAAGLLLLAELAHAQSDPLHGHLNVGAVGKNQGDALTFDNGAVQIRANPWLSSSAP